MSLTCVIPVESTTVAFSLEQYLHSTLKDYKVLNEWFDCPLDLIHNQIAKFIRIPAGNIAINVEILDIINSLAKREVALIHYLYDQVAENILYKEVNPYIVDIRKSEGYTRYLEISMQKHYRHLLELDLISRVKKGIYLVNRRYLQQVVR